MGEKNRRRPPIYITAENYEGHIAHLPPYAKLIGPALLYWLDVIEGNFRDLRISDTYRITGFEQDRNSQTGKYDVVIYNESENKELDYAIHFDFSSMKDFNADAVRKTVLAAIQIRHEKDEAETLLR